MRITVQQYSRVHRAQQKSLSINNPRCHLVRTIILQQYYSRKKSENAETEIQLTLCLSRIERSIVESTENKMYQVVITCRLGEDNFKKSSLAEFGRDAHSFAGDREGCCVGGAGAVAQSRGIRWRREQPVLKKHTLTQSN